jgi:hypothetical protein
MRNRVVVLLAVAVAVPAAVARADIGIVRVAPAEARSGERISVTAAGYLGMALRHPFPVVMVSARKAPLPHSCKHGRAICTPSYLPAAMKRPPFTVVGSITHWRPTGPRGVRQGRASLTFRLPRVDPGRYVFALFCLSCMPGSKGSLIVAEEFVLRVTR